MGGEASAQTLLSWQMSPWDPDFAGCWPCWCPSTTTTRAIPAGQSPKLYPVPPNAPLEGGSSSTGDRHVLLVDRDNCTLYEIFDASAKAP